MNYQSLLENTVTQISFKSCFRFLAMDALAFGAASLLATEAQAQCAFGGGFGGYGGGFGYGRGVHGVGVSINYRSFNHGAYRVPVHAYRPASFHTYRRPVWQETTRIDIHSGRNFRYGNNFDYFPAHRPIHRSRHWHY